MLKRIYILSCCTLLLVTVSLSLSCTGYSSPQEPPQSQGSSETPSDSPVPSQESEPSTPSESPSDPSEDSQPIIPPIVLPQPEVDPPPSEIDILPLLPQLGGKPDLIIISINKYEEADGYQRIKYTVENQGEADAGPSTSQLYVEGVLRTSSSVISLAAGESFEGKFVGWTYDLNFPSIEVVADADNVLVESNENNNEKSITFPRMLVYDFITNAPSAAWISSYIPVPPDAAPAYGISFGGDIDDSDGFATYRTNVLMEDNRTYGNVLEMHPRWVDDGVIEGVYHIEHSVRPGEHFYAKVGFLQLPPPQAGDAVFRLLMREVDMPLAPSLLAIELHDTHDGQIRIIDQKLPADSFGKTVDFRLEVQANGASYQDWACWIEAKLVR